jgi:chromate transporter
VTAAAEPAPPPIGLMALFLRFLRFGCLAFGGPVAQIGMIRHELVERDGWISGPRFNRLLAVMQALPGPEAHELCVHLGIRARGRIGGLLAGLGFMLPGLVLMMALAWAYVAFDVEAGAFAPALLAAQAAVLALIARAVARIGGHALTDRALWAVAVSAFIGAAVGAPFWIVLPAAGAVVVLDRQGRGGWAVGVAALAVVACAVAILIGGEGAEARVAPTGEPATILALFLAGLKGGLLTFGGAYTAIPFVRGDVVGRGWVDDGAFLDGVAFAHVIPAPLVIFATFAGWLAGGPWGALAATAGMFLPAFAFSLVLYDRLEAVVETPRLRAFLDGVAAAVVGVIAATVLVLARGLAGPPTQTAILAVIAILALIAAFRLKGGWVAPAILAAAALAGVILL